MPVKNPKHPIQDFIWDIIEKENLKEILYDYISYTMRMKRSETSEKIKLKKD
jgi:hypothetical protein